MTVFSRTIGDVAYKNTSRVNSRKTRLLLIVTELCTGGATNVVLDIASYFNNHPDFEVQLLAGLVPEDRNDVTYLAYEKGIPTRLIPSLANRINPIINMKAVLDIWQIIRQENYDIVHTHSSVAGVIGRLAALATRTNAIVHHVHGWGLQKGMSFGKRALYLNLERLCARFTDRIVMVSRPDIRKGQAHRIGIEDKYTLIYNGIALEEFRQSSDNYDIRSELGLDPKCKLVGMIGRLDEQKNPLDFIRAAAIVNQSSSNAKFLIIGGGKLRSKCEQLIEELDLKGYFFLLGYRDDVARILSKLTITALSSLWEGLPIVFLEAMSAGKPIVANNVDGAEDVVINGETGFLVPPHQPLKMAERILSLLNDDKLCSKMGHVAQQRSCYFSTQRMVEQIEDLYKELLLTDHNRFKHRLTINKK